MRTQDGTIQDVSDTALWVAYYRAQETERPDALFRDPYAKALIGERGAKIAHLMKKTAKYTAWTLAIRTYIIDRFIERVVAEGVDLVLNLGAGLDARPYRMKLPASLLWIEVDHPHMIAHKEEILAGEKPGCRLERVRLDLAEGEKRQALLAEVAGRSKKILVITEGVIPYLTEAQVGDLAEELHAQTAFAYWVAEYFSLEVYPHLKKIVRMQNAPFQFFPSDWWAFFKSRGWAASEIGYLGEVSEQVKRKPPAPWWVFFIAPFVTQKMVKRFRQYTAYVLYKRA